MSSGNAAPSWVVTARDLYLVAMAVFVVNIVIGILNGADVVDFDRNQILTHVHAGTIGWLTLTIVASTFLLFRAADRRLMLVLAVPYRRFLRTRALLVRHQNTFSMISVSAGSTSATLASIRSKV